MLHTVPKGYLKNIIGVLNLRDVLRKVRIKNDFENRPLTVLFFYSNIMNT